MPEPFTPISVGRTLHYHQFAGEVDSVDGPRSCTVAYVWNQGLVNLAVVRYDGTVCSCTSVPFVDPNNPGALQAPPECSPYCTWAPRV